MQLLSSLGCPTGPRAVFCIEPRLRKNVLVVNVPQKAENFFSTSARVHGHK